MIRSYLIFILAMALVGAGCAATASKNPLGSMKESPDVTRQYREYKINPAYNYFYSGVELQPDAIMGIDRSYTVQSKFWHQVDLTVEQLQYWVKWGDRQSVDEGFSRRYMGRYMGAYIADPSGKVIGDWYSKKDWGIFEFPGGNVVIPHPPRIRSGFEYRSY